MTRTSVAELKPLSGQLADWICTVKPAENAAVRTKSRDMLLDILGVCVRGATTSVAVAVRRLLSDTMVGAGTVIGSNVRAAAPAAAFSNGVAAHALELDDGYTRGSVHPSAVVFPAVLAAAEEIDANVGELADALAVGAEVTCRLAEAGHPETYRRGFHNTPLAGVVGAAAGVSYVLKLDPKTTASALGIACSHSGGLFEFLEDGSDVKKLHPGIAARDGWQSVMLARAGISGPRFAFEGRRGYFHAFTGDVASASSVFLQDLGADWRVGNIYFKPHACCRALHAPVDVLLKLRQEQDLSWDHIKQVTISTYAKAAEYANTRIKTLVDAQMSMPVVAVLALTHGRVGVDELMLATQGKVTPAQLGRISVQHSPQFDALYPPLRPVRVKLETVKGTFEAYVDSPYGEPTNPMSKKDLQSKFMSMTSALLTVDRALALQSAIGTDTTKVRALFALTAPAEMDAGRRLTVTTSK